MSFPTPDQKEAIETLDCDLIVTAGAGSGKTKVLVERYIYLLQQGFKTDEILAVTFTRKAALEMKERIREAFISQMLDTRIGEQLERAYISTIHSFCEQLVADHPLQAKIDPRFSIAQEWESQAMLHRAAQTQLAYALADGDERVIAVRETFRSGQQLVSTLVEIYRQMLTRGCRDFVVKDDLDEIRTNIIGLRQELISCLGQWLNWIKSQTISASKQSVVAAINNLWQNHLADKFAEMPISEQKNVVKQLKSLFGGNWAKKLKAEIVKLQSLSSDLHRHFVDLEAAENLTGICELLTKIDQAYMRDKTNTGLLDFNDLEGLAVELLSDPQVRESYKFKHVMVDEAQDINPVQKYIIDQLTKDPATKLFIVGDPKQSIYRFRGAQVEVFLDSKREIESSTGKAVTLAKNFRSRPGIIAFANQFFTSLFADGPIAYERIEPHRAASADPEVELLVTAKEGSLAAGREKEAAGIAKYINKLVWQNNYQYSKITILLRAMSNARLYERALEQQGIPFINLSGRGFYQKQEIQDILYFIYWLQDSLAGISRIAVLRSPFFGISDQGLYWLQAKKPQLISKDDLEKIDKAHYLYPRLQADMASLTAPEFLDKLFECTNFCTNTLSLPMGEQRLANIRKLQDTSQQLCAKGYVSVQEQLTYIEQVIEQSGIEGEARLNNETSNAVTLMTVHGAKGLEFPVVIIADLCRRLTENNSGYLHYHPQFGLTMRDTMKYSQIKELLNQESAAEAQRLLYVAVTRAQDRLVLSGIGHESDYNLNSDIKDLHTWWEWILAKLKHINHDLFDIIELEDQDDGLTEAKNAAATAQDSTTVVSVQMPKKHTQVSFSVTSLMIYARCPRRYYYRYIWRVPELPVIKTGVVTKTLDPLIRGNIIHRVCEHLKEESDPNELLQWSIAMEGVQLDRTQKQELQSILKRYTGSEYYKQSRKRHVDHEVEFAIGLKPWIITGTVDQVIHLPDSLEIMDLKTNYIDQHQIDATAAKYYWQLQIYAWAVHKLIKKPISKVGLYFVFPDVVYYNQDAHLKIDQTEEWLNNTCSKIEKDVALGVDAFPPTQDCDQCPYNCHNISGHKELFGEILAGLGKIK